LKEFIQKIDTVFREYISDSDFEWDDPAGEFEGFDINF